MEFWHIKTATKLNRFVFSNKQTQTRKQKRSAFKTHRAHLIQRLSKECLLASPRRTVPNAFGLRLGLLTYTYIYIHTQTSVNSQRWLFAKFTKAETMNEEFELNRSAKTNKLLCTVGNRLYFACKTKTKRPPPRRVDNGNNQQIKSVTLGMQSHWVNSGYR